MSDKETGASAGGLLNYLHEAFSPRRKKPTEAPASAPEPTPTMTPQLTLTEAPPAQKFDMPEAIAPASSELPDWLSASSPTESASAPLPEAPEAQVVEAPAVEVEAPMPAPEAPADLPAIEAPVVEAPVPAAAVEAKTEADPFAVNREFNGYMETIRQAQVILANGIALNPEEKKKALIAVASSNSLLPKLPPEVLKSVLLMRAVAANNPHFGRDDFQLEMLEAMKVIRTGVAVK